MVKLDILSDFNMIDSAIKDKPIAVICPSTELLRVSLRSSQRGFNLFGSYVLFFCWIFCEKLKIIKYIYSTVVFYFMSSAAEEIRFLSNTGHCYLWCESNLLNWYLVLHVLCPILSQSSLPTFCFPGCVASRLHMPAILLF